MNQQKRLVEQGVTKDMVKKLVDLSNKQPSSVIMVSIKKPKKRVLHS